jgi:hypothetical protein
MTHKNLQAGDFLKSVGTNSQEWARAFMEIIVNEKKDIDESLMVAWFANAIEAGRSVGRNSSRA